LTRALRPAGPAGKDSQERKRGLINKLLVASQDNEAGYIMRSLQVGGWCSCCALRRGRSDVSVARAAAQGARRRGGPHVGGP
jgi:hypothetical protein